MKVALDSNPLYTSCAGVARYVRGLMEGFSSLAIPDLEVFLWAWPVDNLSYRQPGRALRTLYREWVWPRTSGRRELVRKAPDVHHVTSFVSVPKYDRGRRVTTLYDLAVMRMPERFRTWSRLSVAHSLRQLQRSNSLVICISRFTADEARTVLGIPSSRLRVVYCGADSPAPASVSPPPELPKDYLLFVGSLEPGKNLDLLVKAYALARGGHPSLPPLVVAGARWPGVAREAPPPPDWHFLGHVDSALLSHLYRHARALVFPSRYEGFGLPVAEAMAAGCPVICSRVASLPEVAGDAALYAESTPADYLAALRRLLASPTLANELSSAGRSQAQRFTWSSCARDTLAVYREALAG